MVSDRVNLAGVGGSRNGMPEVAPAGLAGEDAKSCAACKGVKPLAEFHRQKSAKTGRHSYCKECYKKRVHRKKPNPVSRRKNNLKSKYGITQEDVDGMFREQEGRCAVCESSFDAVRYVVDHDHDTGEVRGLLCHRCNLAIPILEDYDRLMNAVNYLPNSAINRVIDELAPAGLVFYQMPG